MNALIKNLATKELGYGSDEFKKLTDASINKYKELLGLKKPLYSFSSLYYLQSPQDDFYKALFS